MSYTISVITGKKFKQTASNFPSGSKDAFNRRQISNRLDVLKRHTNIGPIITLAIGVSILTARKQI